MNSNIPTDQGPAGQEKVAQNSIPKWFEEMAEGTGERKISPYYMVDEFSDIYHRNDIKDPEDMECSLKIDRNSSAKYGRRAPITSQLLASATLRNTIVNEDEYLVPNIDNGFDTSIVDDNQDDLEKSWRSLSLFQQSHKGRLDSAKNTKSIIKLSSGIETMSPISSVNSTSSDQSSIYSPTLLEKVPLRSRSEMLSRKNEGAISCRNTIINPLGRKSENNILISKSKSSDNVPQFLINEKSDLHYDVLNENSRNILNSDENRKFSLTSSTTSSLQNLEKHLNEYKLNVAREDILRKEIIRELLSENEKISRKIKETNVSLHARKILRTPSFEDVSTNRKLYNKNSKYKSNYSRAKEKYKHKSDTHIDMTIGRFNSEDVGEFIIPELPVGKILVFNILSTWGDKHYVGLNGLEIFGSDGKIAAVKRIIASPADVSILPECNNDPRIVTNLLDGVNRTQDDVHLWLTPFEKGLNHTITIEFENITTVALIRIWNYNKSRIHSYRGAKDMVITLDGVTIFKGEIAKACGGILGGVDAFGDTILFTLNEEILDKISQNDNSYQTLTSSSQTTTPVKEGRPPTSSLLPNEDIRPYTGALSQLDSASELMKNSLPVYEDQLVFGGTSLYIVFLSNWGNKNMIGLSGLEVVDERDNAILINNANIKCNKDSQIFELERLINGKNLTINPNDMWCIPYDYGSETVISITFDSYKYISGIRIWNYNESLDTTYAGVSRLRILLDDKLILNPVTKDDVFIVRRAPGNLHYDFVQEILFLPEPPPHENECLSPSFKITHSHKEEFYEYPTMPEGFVVQFIVFSTWGDQYYCGLNGLELFDQNGKKICLDQSNICAYPESINVLPNVAGDIRTPEKLIDGINDDPNGAHAWLAPIIPKNLNRIYIVLDHPVIISVIKLWNYSKTPSRGVKEFGVLVDDLLVYNGILDKHSYKPGYSNYRTVLFTDDASILEQELETMIRNSGYGQDVLLMNDNSRTTTGGTDADPALRPFTSVSPFMRGQNSQSS